MYKNIVYLIMDKRQHSGENQMIYRLFIFDKSTPPGLREAKGDFESINEALNHVIDIGVVEGYEIRIVPIRPIPERKLDIGDDHVWPAIF